MSSTSLVWVLFCPFVSYPPVLLTYLRTDLPTDRPAYGPTDLPACLPAYLPANMYVWFLYGLSIWGVQPGSAWVPYGLSHIRVALMDPIWVPHNSPIKKKETISTIIILFKLISLFIMYDQLYSLAQSFANVVPL